MEHALKVTAKTLVIIAQKDSIIPNFISMKTYYNLSTRKQLTEIQGADHNDLFIIGDTIETINQFI